MRITWTYLSTPSTGGTSRKVSIVLGDDMEGMPISGLSGPKWGITVDRVQYARAEAEAIFARGGLKLDDSFVATREFDTLAEALEFRLTHAKHFQVKGTLRIEEGGQSWSAPAIIHSGEPVLVKGVTVEIRYYYIAEGIFV